MSPTQSISRVSSSSVAPGNATLNIVVSEMASVSYRRRMKAWVCVPGCLSAKKTPVTHSWDLDSSYHDLLPITNDGLEFDEVGVPGYCHEPHRGPA